MPDSTPSIYQFILPNGVLELFDVHDCQEKNGKLTIVLKEKPVKPPEHKDKALVSKGYFQSTKVQDFPIREYKVFLEVYRRKWYDPHSKNSYCRDLNLAANGTSFTKEFADFLKEVVGPIPNQYKPTRKILPSEE